MYTPGIPGPPAALFGQHDVSLPRNLTMHFSLKALPSIPNPHPTHNLRLVYTKIYLGEGLSKPTRDQNRNYPEFRLTLTDLAIRH